jgi:hypothetical protein
MTSKALIVTGLCVLAVALALPAAGAAATGPLKAIALGQDTSESFGADGIHLDIASPWDRH